MPASLTLVGLTFVTLLVGCSQPDSPTGPISNRLPGASSATATAGETAVAADHQVPFKGRFEATSTTTFDPPPSPFFSVLLEGTGNATHLGRFTLEAPHRVNSTTGRAVGTFRFTAANGDRLIADFTGVSAPTAIPGVFDVVETATISGGTGRFAGATGGFIVMRVVDLSTPLADGSFEGTISLLRADEE